MTVPDGHREFFGDGAGNAVVAPLTFATAGSTVSTYGDSELILNLLGAGTAATWYEIRMMLARPGSTDWQPMPVVYGSIAGAEIVEQEALIVRVDGANGEHSFVLKTPPLMQVRIDVRRVGGDGTTTALVTGYVREVVGELSISALSLAAGATLTQDINIEGVNGTVVAPNVVGHLPVESDIRQLAGQDVAATNVAGTFPVEADHREVAGATIATTGVSGTLPMEGTVADDAVSDASFPLKIGAVADEVETAVADDDAVHLITDLLRRLKVVSASFDTLTDSDQVTNLNTDSTDMDSDYQIDADATDEAVATYEYPSATGREYGTRNKRTWTLTLDEVTSCALMESDDDFVTEVDVTASLIDRGTGLTGYAATHFTATGAAVVFKVQMDQPSYSKSYRWDVLVAGAGTNDVLITTFGRAN